MSEQLRELLYPLGFLSSLAFSARMLLQWLKSEAKGESIVTPTFWKLSLCGNLLLLTHAFIQAQFHVCLVQACNAVISWRNLNLMKPPAKQTTTLCTIFMLILAIVLTVCGFLFQAYFLNDVTEWFRIPATPWQVNAGKQVSFIWHIIGLFGLLLFSSRFWLQWWLAEKYKQSFLGSSFWWFSLAGESLCLIYFLRIGDPVNFIGPAFGLIPYVRNLMLLSGQRKMTSKEVL
jgi:lipid-A-disaccharide synthase-like uncharacterized protein